MLGAEHRLVLQQGLPAVVVEGVLRIEFQHLDHQLPDQRHGLGDRLVEVLASARQVIVLQAVAIAGQIAQGRPVDGHA